MVNEPTSELAYIGLGANLGDPIEQLVAARRQLAELPMVEAVRSSSMYVSSPVGYEAQPDFVNCVLEVLVCGSHRDFFEALQTVELKMGRQRDLDNQNAPRVIDIDLLLFGGQFINEPDLIVPHPRMHMRLFVLTPLQELNSRVEMGFKKLDCSSFSGQSLHRLAL